MFMCEIKCSNQRYTKPELTRNGRQLYRPSVLLKTTIFMEFNSRSYVTHKDIPQEQIKSKKQMWDMPLKKVRTMSRFKNIHRYYINK